MKLKFLKFNDLVVRFNILENKLVNDLCLFNLLLILFSIFGIMCKLLINEGSLFNKFLKNVLFCLLFILIL